MQTATPSPMLEKLLRQYIAELAEAEKPAPALAPKFTLPPGWPADFVPILLESRTHVSTSVMCRHLGRKEQTARGWACLENGPLRPDRVHGRLAWPVSEIKRVLGVPA